MKFKINKAVVFIIFLLFAIDNSNAQNYQWAKDIGSLSCVNTGYGVTVDVNGNVYSVGSFKGIGIDFDPGPGTYMLSSANNDIFISKLDSNGNFIWAKQFGGINSDIGISINIDLQGNVYTTGYFENTVDFDPGIGTYNLISSGTYAAFISKLDSNGNFVWAISLDGGESMGLSITKDNIGNFYISGRFNYTTDFDPGIATYNLTSTANDDVFILKIDNGGNFIWAKKMGGSQYDVGATIKIATDGSIYSIGTFEGTANFDPNGTYNLTSSGSDDIFVSKLDANGNFVWARKMGGSGIDEGTSISIDNYGNVYGCGTFRGNADFDPGIGVYNLISNDPSFENFYICKLDSNGNFGWAKGFGAPSAHDLANSIVLDDKANVYATGNFQSVVDFDPGSGVFNLSSTGGTDIFILKLDSGGNFNAAKNMGNTQSAIGLSIATDPLKNIYLTGSFSGTVDFDPPNVVNLSAAGTDAFIAKYSQLSTGIFENSFGNTFTIYPNPFNSSLTIQINKNENMEITLYDFTSRKTIQQTFTNNITLNTEQLAKGIYFYELRSNDANNKSVIKTGKVVKQ